MQTTEITTPSTTLSTAASNFLQTILENWNKNQKKDPGNFSEDKDNNGKAKKEGKKGSRVEESSTTVIPGVNFTNIF